MLCCDRPADCAAAWRTFTADHHAQPVSHRNVPSHPHHSLHSTTAADCGSSNHHPATAATSHAGGIKPSRPGDPHTSPTDSTDHAHRDSHRECGSCGWLQHHHHPSPPCHQHPGGGWRFSFQAAHHQHHRPHAGCFRPFRHSRHPRCGHAAAGQPGLWAASGDHADPNGSVRGDVPGGWQHPNHQQSPCRVPAVPCHLHPHHGGLAELPGYLAPGWSVSAGPPPHHHFCHFPAWHDVAICRWDTDTGWAESGTDHPELSCPYHQRCQHHRCHGDSCRHAHLAWWNDTVAAEDCSCIDCGWWQDATVTTAPSHSAHPGEADLLIYSGITVSMECLIKN